MTTEETPWMKKLPEKVLPPSRGMMLMRTPPVGTSAVFAE